MRTLLLGLSLLVMLPGTLPAQQVRARLVDAVQRAPLDAVRIVVMDSAGIEWAAASTGSDGFFTVDGLAEGSYTLVAERDGYATLRQPLVVRGVAPVTLPAILMQSRAFSLDTVRAEARVRGGKPPAEKEEVYPESLLAGARLAELEKLNASPAAVYRELASGVRLRNENGRLCVPATRGPQSMRSAGGGSRQSSCMSIAVVVDGFLVSNSAPILRNLSLHEWESIEYLSPIQAGLRYGLGVGPGGAIVLWTRGAGPHRSASRDGGLDTY